MKGGGNRVIETKHRGRHGDRLPSGAHDIAPKARPHVAGKRGMDVRNLSHPCLGFGQPILHESSLLQYFSNVVSINLLSSSLDLAILARWQRVGMCACCPFIPVLLLCFGFPALLGAVQKSKEAPKPEFYLL